MFYEHMKWSHGDYEHFTLDDSLQTHAKKSLFSRSVEIHVFQKSGEHVLINVQQFDKVTAAVLMKIQSILKQNAPRNPEIHEIMNL
jgi:hypothetical protein